jgi:hypothetical protein
MDLGLLFTTRKGTPIESRNVNRTFAALIARASVTNREETSDGLGLILSMRVRGRSRPSVAVDVAMEVVGTSLDASVVDRLVARIMVQARSRRPGM